MGEGEPGILTRWRWYIVPATPTKAAHAVFICPNCARRREIYKTDLIPERCGCERGGRKEPDE